jgi:TonB family protein
MMKSILAAGFFLTIYISAIAQNRQTIPLRKSHEKDVVVYTTATAAIYFNKDEITGGFALEKNSDWYRGKNQPEKDELEKAISKLSQLKGTYLVFANDAKASADKKQIAMLIKERLGSSLLFANRAMVINITTKKLQDSIDVAGKYTFYFKKAREPFFKHEYSEPVIGTASLNEDKMLDTRVVIEDSVIMADADEGPEDEDKLFTVVEQSPEYPGGMVKFFDYIKDSLQYPARDKKLAIEGTVFVQFVVEKDGSITSLECIKSPDNDMCKEALRLIRKSGKWQPGKQNGQVVRVEMTIPVKFNLSKK